MKESIIKDLYCNFVESSNPPHLYHLLNERIETTTVELKSVLYRKNKKS